MSNKIEKDRNKKSYIILSTDNIRNFTIKNLSLEYSDYRHGESVRPIEIIYNPNGQFSGKCLQKVL